MKRKFKVGDKIIVTALDHLDEKGTVVELCTELDAYCVELEGNFIPTSFMDFYEKEMDLLPNPADIFRKIITSKSKQ